MAIALVNHTSAGSSDTNNVTTSSIDTTGATLLVAWIVFDFTAAEPSFSDNKSNTWTSLTIQSDGAAARGRWRYVANPTVGTGHTVTASGTTDFPAVCFLAFSGVAAASPFDVQNGAASSSAVTTLAPGSITPGQNNELVLVGLGVAGAISSLSIGGSGFTITDQVAFSSGAAYGADAAYKVQTTAGAENPAWSWTTAETCVAAIASFKAAAAAAQQQQLTLLGCGS